MNIINVTQYELEKDMGLIKMEEVFYKMPDGDLKERLRVLILTSRALARDIVLRDIVCNYCVADVENDELKQ